MKEAIAQMRVKGTVLPKSKLGVALGYLENNWETLTTCLLDEWVAHYYLRRVKHQHASEDRNARFAL